MSHFSAKQTNKVFTLLQSGPVSRVTAMHYGVMNLTARIADIRNAGYKVECTIKTDHDGNRYGSFQLASDPTSWRARLGIGTSAAA